MALFGFGKKKDEEKNIPACACQSDCATFEATEEDANKVKIEDGAMSVKVLGVGCASCHEQYEQAKAAVKSMGLKNYYQKLKMRFENESETAEH